MESPHNTSNDDLVLNHEHRPANQEKLPLDQHVAIKLFVGRLPTTMTAENIRPIFEKFGSVIEVIVIRDKVTGAHKGSAFVRMASIQAADEAIRVLSTMNEKETEYGPLQINYAVGEPERLGFSPGALTPGEDEAKVFIGSLPRDVTEKEIIDFFVSYGPCHDVYLMKDPQTKRLKGCGFLKFEQKEQALLAIKALHGVAQFPRASRPLELRIAELKRLNPTSTTSNRSSNYYQNTAMSGGGGGGAPTTATSTTNYRQQQQRNSYIVPAQNVSTSSNATIFHLNANPRSAGHWKEYYTNDGRPYYHNSYTSVTQWDIPREFSQTTSPVQQRNDTETTGPPGANIFVFHIPNDWGKEELISQFSRFGHIVSAMVAIDYTTQRNKGYGFVSYNNIQSALQAVKEMNLLTVGTKRLRVAIKNGEIEHARLFAQQHSIPMSKGKTSNSSVPMYHQMNNHQQQYRNNDHQGGGGASSTHAYDQTTATTTANNSANSSFPNHQMFVQNPNSYTKHYTTATHPNNMVPSFTSHHQIETRTSKATNENQQQQQDSSSLQTTAPYATAPNYSNSHVNNGTSYSLQSMSYAQQHNNNFTQQAQFRHV